LDRVSFTHVSTENFEAILVISAANFRRFFVRRRSRRHFVSCRSVRPRLAVLDVSVATQWADDWHRCPLVGLIAQHCYNISGATETGVFERSFTSKFYW